MSLNNLTKGERFVFDWQYKLAGSFNTHLAIAISKADMENLEKLRKGFPEEVQAMENYRSTPNWWEGVLEKVESN